MGVTTGTKVANRINDFLIGVNAGVQAKNSNQSTVNVNTDPDSLGLPIDKNILFVGGFAVLFLLMFKKYL